MELVTAPRDVAVLAATFLRLEDLRALVQVCHGMWESPLREAMLARVRLRLPPDDACATSIVTSISDAGMACCVTAVNTADPAYLLHMTEFTKVKHLRISRSEYLGEYESPLALLGLEMFCALQALDLSSSSIVGVAVLASLPQLTRLYLSSTLVVDVSPLRSLVRLQVLDLARTRVKSISCVTTMADLRELNLNDTESLDDLTPLRSLRKLETLSINNKDLTEIGSLYALTPTLKTLHAVEVQIRPPNIAQQDRNDALACMTQLESLELWPARWIQTLDPLRSLTQLKKLDIRFPPFVDVAPLQALNNLEELHLMISATRDTSPLRALKRIKRLDLTGCPRDASLLNFLAHLPELRDLRCSGEIHAGTISRLVQLEVLELYYSSATWDVTPPSERLPRTLFAALTKVVKLTLRFPVGHPADLSVLACMKQLETLDLRYATPRTLPSEDYFVFLRSLTQLRDLRLSGGGISSLVDLAGLTKLEFLDLDSTEVEDVSPLQQLGALRVLQLKYTRVVNVLPLVELSNLRHIVLPVQADCTPLVAARLPQLRHILHQHRNCMWNQKHRDESAKASGSDEPCETDFGLLESVFGY